MVHYDKNDVIIINHYCVFLLIRRSGIVPITRRSKSDVNAKLCLPTPTAALVVEEYPNGEKLIQKQKCTSNCTIR